MKKIFFVLFFVFIINVSNTSAVTQTGLNNLSTSFDIGSYMQTTYYRYKCNSKDRCEKTQTKTDGDFDSEKECLNNCPPKALSYTTSNINSNFNFTTTTKAVFNSSNIFNSSLDNIQIKPNAIPQASLPQASTDGISGLDFGPSALTKSISGLQIAPLKTNDSVLIQPTVKPNSIIPDEPMVIGKSMFSGLLQGLGIIKPTALVPNDAAEMLDGPTPDYPAEPQPADDYIWYLKEYSYNLWGNIIKGGDHLMVYYQEPIEITGVINIKKKVQGRWEHVGLLYSYLNESGQRIFNNDTEEIYITGSSNSKQVEWFRGGLDFEIKIPNDIKVTNKMISIEAMVVALPATYDYLKNPTNNYKTWNSFNKKTLSYSFADKQASSDFLKTNCKFKFIKPEPKSTFVSGKDPYHTGFNLSVEMNCDQLTKTKNKPDPESVHIYYEMRCPKQFNSDYTEWYSYHEMFAQDSKYFDIDFDLLDTSKRVFSQKFELENGNLLDMLYYQNQKHESEDSRTVWPYGLAKRCDLLAHIYSHGDEIAILKDYFYLNQCKVNIINEKPNAVYCTEDKNGGHFPINVKLVFSNCSRELFDYDTLKYLHFEIVPNPTPHKQWKDIKDNKTYEYYGGFGSLADGYDHNGQTIYTDVNGINSYVSEYWDRYFSAKGVTKNMPDTYSTLSFFLKAYEYNNLIFVLPMENRGTSEQFKIYYGSDYKNCSNNIAPTPMPTLPGPTYGSIEPRPEKPPNILSRIWNFLKFNLK